MTAHHDFVRRINASQAPICGEERSVAAPVRPPCRSVRNRSLGCWLVTGDSDRHERTPEGLRTDARVSDADAMGRLARSEMVEARARTRKAEEREEAAGASQREADERMADAVALVADARDDGDEYQRALDHYTQLVRHRMANPLQVISGLARVLDETPDLDADQRRSMISSIRRQANLLEAICLEPRVASEAERGLQPRPFETLRGPRA